MCVRVQQPYEHVTGQCPFLCGTCTICTPVALIPLDHVQGRRPLQSLGMRPAKCFLVRRWWEFCQHSSFSSMSVAFSPTFMALMRGPRTAVWGSCWKQAAMVSNTP